MPGKARCATLDSLALLMMLNWLSENCVPLPLKTRVRARLGVSTIIPGVLPAEMGETMGCTSRTASTMNTPAVPLPELTLLVRKARYLRPLVCVLLEGVLPPQLSHIRLAGSRNIRRIRAFFKPGTPTSCRIITWMQEQRIIAKEEMPSFKVSEFQSSCARVQL